MTFKHITNWTEQNINFNDTYSTDWTVSNYWKNKVSNENEIQETTNSLFDSIQSILSLTGKSFDFSSLSNELQKLKYRIRYLILEDKIKAL